MYNDAFFPLYEFKQKIRSDAFKEISRRSMNQWRILTGVRRGKLDCKTQKYLENVTYFYSEGDGLQDCFFHGVTPPVHPDDIREWIQDAHTFDELDTIRFRLNNYQYLRGRTRT